MKTDVKGRLQELTPIQKEAINKLTELKNRHAEAALSGEITKEEFIAKTEGVLQSEHPLLWEVLESLKVDLNSDQC